MTKTIFHKIFSPLKKILPRSLANFFRSIGTAFIGPIRKAYRSGYYLSTFKMAPVTRQGKPLPWYTYPAIDFLKYRDYSGKNVLEFGGGQSTLWWAEQAEQVVTFEGDNSWYQEIRDNMPDNVELIYVSMDDRESNINKINESLTALSNLNYDVVIIDGLYRIFMVPIAVKYLSNDGIIICDNAESYDFNDKFKDSDFQRIDFFGNAPGVILPHSTSIYFKRSSFVFKLDYPIPNIAKD